MEWKGRKEGRQAGVAKGSKAMQNNIDCITNKKAYRKANIQAIIALHHRPFLQQVLYVRQPLFLFLCIFLPSHSSFTFLSNSFYCGALQLYPPLSLHHSVSLLSFLSTSFPSSKSH